MHVRVMAACMESQADILECTASAQSGRREVTVCFSPMSMISIDFVYYIVLMSLCSVSAVIDALCVYFLRHLDGFFFTCCQLTCVTFSINAEFFSRSYLAKI